MTVFDIFTDILNKKSGGKLCEGWQFKISANNYMMVRLLRMKPGLHKFANIANRYQSIWSKEEMYRWLFMNVPKFKSTHVSYIAKPKKPEEKKKGKMLTKDEFGYVIF